MRALDPELQFASYQKFLKKTYRHLNEQEQRIAREKQGREEMESLLFSMVEGVVATDSSGRISFLNPAAEQIFQIEHGSALGKYPREVWREFELVEMFHQVFVTGQPQSREFQMDTPQKAYLKVEIIPIRWGEEEEGQGVLAIVRDLHGCAA